MDPLSRGTVVQIASDNGASAVLIVENSAGGVERGRCCWVLQRPADPWLGCCCYRQKRVATVGGKGGVPEGSINVVDCSFCGRGFVDSGWAGSAGGMAGVSAGSVVLVALLWSGSPIRKDQRVGSINNVFGVIRGREEPDQSVILGYQRAAWTYGGVDSNSRTTALLDFVRRYGVLLKSE